VLTPNPQQVCGESSATPLPTDPAAVTIDSETSIQRIREVAECLASCLRGAGVEATQACYLPVTADGLPLIGQCVLGFVVVSRVFAPLLQFGHSRKV